MENKHNSFRVGREHAGAAALLLWGSDAWFLWTGIARRVGDFEARLMILAQPGPLTGRYKAEEKLWFCIGAVLHSVQLTAAESPGSLVTIKRCLSKGFWLRPISY